MEIRLEGVTKKYKDIHAVKDFSASLPDGKLICLLGPSGCGKTTLLNMLCGIIPVTSGKIFFDQLDVTNLEPDKRHIGMVFQNYALYPHLNVLENITFPLEVQKIPKKERLQRAMEIAKVVHVDSLLKRFPSELSGGQQQRVAIARALVKKPELLLMDEPLSNLDARLRLEMREEIRRIQNETGVTTIFVTHDQEEAMAISDSIILMKDGMLIQEGYSQDLYENPCCRFTADFLGNPPINDLEYPSGIPESLMNLHPILNKKTLKMSQGEDFPNSTSKKLLLSLRPECFIIKKDSSQSNSFPAVVKNLSLLGKEQLCILELPTFSLKTSLENNKNDSVFVRAVFGTEEVFELNQSLTLSFAKKGVFLFNLENGERVS